MRDREVLEMLRSLLQSYDGADSRFEIYNLLQIANQKLQRANMQRININTAVTKLARDTTTNPEVIDARKGRSSLDAYINELEARISMHEKLLNITFTPEDTVRMTIAIQPTT